jgi:hypothetical protein
MKPILLLTLDMDKIKLGSLFQKINYLKSFPKEKARRFYLHTEAIFDVENFVIVWVGTDSARREIIEESKLQVLELQNI